MNLKPDPAALTSSTGEDALARHWTLAVADAAEVLRARGAEHRLRCAVQLCSLRATGHHVQTLGNIGDPLRREDELAH